MIRALSRLDSGGAMPPDPRLLAILARLSRGAGAAAVVVGLLVLAGWALDVVLLKSIAPGLAPMKPNAALAFVLCSLSLCILQSDPVSRRASVVALACSTTIVVIALLTLSEYLFGRDLGIDLLLFGEAVSTAGNAARGRISAATALLFLLSGVALQILALPGKRGYAFAQFLALIALAVSTTALLGYAYGVGALYKVPLYRGMAFHSSIVHMVLATGILFAIAVRSESSLLASVGAGGMMLRRLWVPSIGILVILSWLRLQGEKAGLYTFEVGLAIMVLFAIVVLTVFIWRIARHLDRVDAERTRAEDEMRDSKRRLEDVFVSVAEGIVSVDEDYRIVLFNPAAEQIFGRSKEEMLRQPLGLLVPERFRAQHESHIRTFAATEQTKRSMGRYGQIYGLRANGEEFPIEATISQTATGRNRLFTVILRDISERLRMEQALRDYTEQLRRLSRRLFEAEESERRRLARELHDRIGQNVTALTLNLNMVRGALPADHLQKIGINLDDCETLLYSTGQLVRDIMADLRPPGLDQLGLLAALTEHARQVAARSGISATVSGTEIAPRLPPEAEITLFRIAQEALLNVAKHARATEAAIALEAGPDKVIMTLSDNGCGFDAAAELSRASASLGLVSMRERAESIGGRLRVESAPGRGTRVIVEARRAPPTPWPRRLSGQSPTNS